MQNHENSENGYESEVGDGVYASETPDLKNLIAEYRRSNTQGGNAGGMTESENIRLSRWDGQSEDGKKHSENMPEGKPAFPFEGASDTRQRIIDRTINEIVAMLMTTFDRCQIKVKGTEYGDSEGASVASILTSWLIESRLRPQLRDEAELLAQYTLTHGWSALAVVWEQEFGIRFQTITIQQLAEIAQEAAARAQQAGITPPSIVDLPAAIADEKQEDYAVDLICQYLNSVDPAEVKKHINELRETGTCHIPEQFVSKNQPLIEALKPFDEICFPPETSDIQKASVVFRRSFVTEVELRAMAAREQWDEDFVAAAVATKGKTDAFAESSFTQINQNNTNGLDRYENSIELVYAYSRQLDKDGVPGVYQTIFVPSVGCEHYASHGLLGYAHNKYPFVIYKREKISRAVTESRGIPEIAKTDQFEIKTQHDSIGDRTSFETMPPILVKKRLQGINKIAPGIHLPVTSNDDYSFMQPPAGTANLAMALIDKVEYNHSLYFGLPHPNITPSRTQTTQQFIVNNWLAVWSEVSKQALQLMLQYLTADEIKAITGQNLPQAMSSISNMFDFQVKYDVREMDTDFTVAKLKALNQFVLPLDSTGVLDKAKLVKAAVEAIDPDKAHDLIINTGTASQMLYKNIQSDIALMMLGNEAQYVENDPTAETKLQYLQDVAQKNPKVASYLQSDGHFRALFETYVKNLQMSTEQQKNKQIGRTGVTPVSERAASQLQGSIESSKEAAGE